MDIIAFGVNRFHYKRADTSDGKVVSKLDEIPMADGSSTPEPPFRKDGRIYLGSLHDYAEIDLEGSKYIITARMPTGCSQRTTTIITGGESNIKKA